MSDLLANESARLARRFPRRTERSSPDRLPHVDMRTRAGKLYRHAFNAALLEFPGVDLSVIAQLARLRLLAEQEEIAALAGRGSAMVAARIGNVALRLSRDISSRGKPEATGQNVLQNYLAGLNAQQEAEDVEAEEQAEVSP
jgi:hypothetical protein